MLLNRFKVTYKALVQKKVVFVLLSNTKAEEVINIYYESNLLAKIILIDSDIVHYCLSHCGLSICFFI